MHHIIQKLYSPHNPFQYTFFYPTDFPKNLYPGIFRYLQRREFCFKIYPEYMVVVVQYNILPFTTSVKLIKFILYFIVVLLMNERDSH